MALELREFPGAGDPSYLLPPPSEFLSALREGRLVLQGCDACGRLHFRQWFRACGGRQFYVCTVARHAMLYDLASGWRLVTLHDLVRWLLSSLATERAA